MRGMSSAKSSLLLGFINSKAFSDKSNYLQFGLFCLFLDKSVSDWTDILLSSAHKCALLVDRLTLTPAALYEDTNSGRTASLRAQRQMDDAISTTELFHWFPFDLSDEQWLKTAFSQLEAAREMKDIQEESGNTPLCFLKPHCGGSSYLSQALAMLVALVACTLLISWTYYFVQTLTYCNHNPKPSDDEHNTSAIIRSKFRICPTNAKLMSMVNS